MAAVVGACGTEGGDDLGPAATLGTGPTTTSAPAPEPVDVAVIPEDPADIDEAYVQAVVDALFAVDAQATKIFVETRAPDDRAIDYLEAIYLPEELDRQINSWFQTLARGSETLLPGALLNDVDRLISAGTECTFFAVTRNYSMTTTRDVPPRTVYLGITPKDADDDPNDLNPTAWMLFTDGFNEDGSEPPNPC